MRYTFAVLAAIAVVGLLGIPLGDPRFLQTAVLLECMYIALAALALLVRDQGRSRMRKAMVTVPSIVLASMVIIANTLSGRHLSIMISLTPLYNALILIVGGYILQILLIASSLIEYSRSRLNIASR